MVKCGATISSKGLYHPLRLDYYVISAHWIIVPSVRTSTAKKNDDAVKWIDRRCRVPVSMHGWQTASILLSTATFIVLHLPYFPDGHLHEEQQVHVVST